MIDTERLADIFRRYPGILAVYLFGSHALGRARPDSDVDLAILPSGPGLRNQKLELLTDLAEAGYCNAEPAGRHRIFAGHIRPVPVSASEIRARGNHP